MFLWFKSSMGGGGINHKKLHDRKIHRASYDLVGIVKCIFKSIGATLDLEVKSMGSIRIRSPQIVRENAPNLHRKIRQTPNWY